MRTMGVDESYITGDKSDEEKFTAWAKTVPYTVRNPLFHWTHLELQRYFWNKRITYRRQRKEVFQITQQKLATKEYGALGLLKQRNVELVCTTEDPTDDLASHISFAKKKDDKVKMSTSFRPDKAFAVEDPEAYVAYLEQLGSVVGISINSYDALLGALSTRVDYFHENGCRLSDHGLNQLHYFEIGAHNVHQLFDRVYSGEKLKKKEAAYFMFETLVHLCRMYHEKGWTQQFHLGALRNTNKRMLRVLGPDTGFDSIGDYSQAEALAGFLNFLDNTDQLSKTILYNLNPSDNEVFAAMIGNFNDGSIKGKMQFGSGWWFLDQKDGMEKQLNSLSNMGILSCFIGMLTDSRSFLSFPRHEYFRRILCNLIGNDVANGELPNDEKWLGKIVSDICYHNAKGFLGL